MHQSRSRKPITYPALIEVMRTRPADVVAMIADGSVDHIDCVALLRAALEQLYFAGRETVGATVIDAVAERESATPDLPGRLNAFEMMAHELRERSLFRKALALQRVAYDLATELDSPNAMAWDANNLALCHHKLGEFREAHSMYVRALEHASQIEDKSVALRIETNRVVGLESEGEHRAALLRLETLVPKLIDARIHELACVALATLAKCRVALGNRKRGETDARAALQLAVEFEIAPRWKEVALTALGVSLEHHDPKGALDSFEQALTIVRQTGNQRRLAAALHNTGCCAGAAGDIDLACKRWQEAFDLAVALEDTVGQAIIAGRIGEAHMARKPPKIAEAIHWREQEAAQCRRHNNHTALASSLRELAKARLVLALSSTEQSSAVASAEGGIVEAAAAMRLAARLALVGELRPEAVSSLRDLANIAARTLKVGPARADIADVWMLIDASRGLAERIAHERELAIRSSATNNPEATQAARELSEARKLVVEQRAKGRLADEAENSVRDSEGRLSHLLFGTTSTRLPRGLADRQAFLADLATIIKEGDTAVITYVIAGPEVLALIGTNEGTGWHGLEITPQALRLACRLMHWSLAVARRRVGASVLHHALLTPLLPRIGDRNLLVIADSRLADLPWGALDPVPAGSPFDLNAIGPELDSLLDQRSRLIARASESDDRETPDTLVTQVRELDGEIEALAAPLRSGDDHRALFDDRVVTVCSSIGTAARLADTAALTRDAHGLVALADPALADESGPQTPEGRTLKAVNTVHLGRRAASASLPYTRMEVSRAAALLGASIDGRQPAETSLDGHFVILTGLDATKQRLEEALASTRDRKHAALHLGAHGVVVDDGIRPGTGKGHTGAEHTVPPQVAILLSQGDTLTALDIASFKMRTFVTTLFCCHSRLGSAPPPGLDGGGLCASFHFAGSAHVVACTDAVPDSSTAALSDEFYTQVAAGVPPAAALGRAQRVIRDMYPEYPTAWAPFLVSGPRPVWGLARRRPQAHTSMTASFDVAGSALPWQISGWYD